jgi:hypothetical protein
MLPAKARYVFKGLRECLARKQIDLIVGPRNAGKTTLLYQLIDHLLKTGTDPKHILYCSFDERRVRFPRVLNDYQRGIVKGDLAKERVYFFLDEIHKLEGWEPKLMYLNDTHPKLKIVATSSMALDLMMGQARRARFRFHHLQPLSFSEFLHFRGEPIPRVEGLVSSRDFESMLRLNFQAYARRGFPEIVEVGERFVRRYIREFLLTRIIYRDIWEVFEVKDMSLVRDIADLLISNPGYVVNVNSLASELGKARITVRNVFDYLEFTYLIRRFPNLRGPKLTPSRKNLKVYPVHSSLVFAVREEEPEEKRLVEVLVSSEVKSLGYWSTGVSEVGFVVRVGDKLVPIEVNLSDRLTEADFRGLKNFCRRFKTERGILLTRTMRGQMKWAELIPAYLFLAYPKKFLSAVVSAQA